MLIKFKKRPIILGGHVLIDKLHNLKLDKNGKALPIRHTYSTLEAKK